MNRFNMCLIVMATLAVASARPNDPAPNTLTAKEIADGWILLFDGQTTFGWKTEGEVKVEGGWLKLGGDKPAKIAHHLSFRDFELRAEYANVERGQQSIDIFSRILSAKVPAGKVGTFEMMNKGDYLRTGHIRVEGEVIGEEKFSFSGGGMPPIPFVVETPAKGGIALRSIKLRPIEMRPLFNSKDLTGWHEHPQRKASKWSVEEGVLRVRNGPGDLQTDGQWADFVLQAEIRTHGKALNSGIFFRCIPGDYQNGYEAQIQNGFKDGDRSKPADFGTGAIYRRIAARKVVSDDDAWFTMTVAAQGNRIATWVNGYMTVAWVDERPANNNPRNGSKTDKGAISLQGHDPTTDISFRQIRLGELPSAK